MLIYNEFLVSIHVVYAKQQDALQNTIFYYNRTLCNYEERKKK